MADMGYQTVNEYEKNVGISRIDLITNIWSDSLSDFIWVFCWIDASSFIRGIAGGDTFRPGGYRL